LTAPTFDSAISGVTGISSTAAAIEKTDAE
jgi:hypothetical protein